MVERTPSTPLTPLETDVLVLVARGYTGRQIARELHLSLGSVATHLRDVRVKLGVRSTVHAVAKAVRMGWIQP